MCVTTPRFTQRLPLRLLLFVPLAMQVLVVSGIGYLSVKNEQHSVDVLVNELMAENSDQITQNLDTYLQSPLKLLEVSINMMDLGQLKVNDFEASGDYFWRQIQTFENISYIGYALTTGEFAGAGGFLQGQGITIDEISPKTEGNNFTYATDSQGQRTEVVKVYTPEDWNPLLDPGYTEAVKQNKPVAASPFVWADDPDIISVPISYPFYDEQQILQGVLTAEFTLSKISDFLRTLEISPSAEIFILEKDGNLIANSVAKNPFKMVDGSAERLSALDSQTPLISVSAKYLQMQIGGFEAIATRQEHRVRINGQRHYVQVTPWQDELGLDWLVVLVVPEADFMAPIYAHSRSTLLLCLGALGLAIGFGVYIVQRISKPVSDLKRASQALAAGDFTQQVEVQGIEEIESLGTSFNQMAMQLKGSFAALETSNQNLEQVNNELASLNNELEQRVESRTAQLSATLTELRQTQAHMVQSEKMSALGQMVAGVAHEINNPVNFIHGNLKHIRVYADELLQAIDIYQAHGAALPAPQQETIDDLDLVFLKKDLVKVVQSMKVGTTRIREIVLSLRNFSRLDESESKAVNIHEGIDSTLTILQNRLKGQAGQTAIEVVKEYGELPLVECYAGQLNQVFMNILGNAIEALLNTSEEAAHAPHPEIRLYTAVRDDEWVVIHIMDNGAGMPEDVRSQIFNPFFTTKPVGKGTGLGLSISYQIITERHNGRIDCDSALGKGTKFVIELPIHQPTA